MLRWRPLFKWIDLDAWRWIEAVATVESHGRPEVIGDHGLAVGVFQMHPDFWRDFGPPGYGLDTRKDVLTEAITFSNFWWSCDPLKAEDRLAIYHYGAGTAKHLDGADPDGTIGRYIRAYQAIEE